ncbi:hypothetical protein MTO96_015966 [Rhipicephalus appendiculatus]
MPGSPGSVTCFRCASGLTQGLAGVVQCLFALLFKLSQEDGFVFGINLILGLTNIPLGCVITTAFTQQTECSDPHGYVSLNRFSVALSWHSALFNAVCALVLVWLPSPPYSRPDQVPPTRFHGYWLAALDYVSVASVVIPWIIVVLSFCCLLTLTRSPLRNVVPSTESVAFVQDGRRGDITLRPFKWVYQSTDRSLSPRELPLHRQEAAVHARRQHSLSPHRGKFTFKRCSGACVENLSRPGPSHTDGGQSHASQTGGSRAGRTATADASTGCSTDDFDEDCVLDSFISDSFDESVCAAVADHPPPQTRCTGASLAKNAGSTEDSRATNIREHERERRPPVASRSVCVPWRGFSGQPDQPRADRQAVEDVRHAPENLEEF